VAETIDQVVGYISDPVISEKIHNLSHQGTVEYVVIEQKDTLRRRIRIQSDRGTECLVAIPRNQTLSDGAVLLLEKDRAIVIRLTAEEWLSLLPTSIEVATELGYFVGNLHWRVRFDGPILLIALEGPEEDYLARLRPFLESGRAKRVDHEQ
jgi:urease accessory protein